MKRLAITIAALAVAGFAQAQSPAPAAPSAAPGYDAELAKSLGANDQGLRAYILVVLKNGPNRMPAGPERDAMFRGHFANIKRLSDDGKLVYAGPLDGTEGRRGIFIFALTDMEEAKKLTAADPVIEKGEMVADFHKHFGSAALMQVPQTHPKIVKKPM